MSKKELYYFYVSVDNGTKNKPYYNGFTVATSEDNAQSQAVSYVHDTYYPEEKKFFTTAVATKAAFLKNSNEYIPDTIAIVSGKLGDVNLGIEETKEIIEVE